MSHPWRIGDALWAVLAGFVAASAALLALDTLEPTAFETFGVVLPAQEIATFGVFLWLARRRGVVAPLRELGLPPAATEAWLVGLGVALAVLATVALAGLTDIEEAPQEIARIAREATGLTAVLAAVGTVVVAPLVEEVVFRGVLLRGLEHHMPFAGAAVLSSAAFAAFHYTNPNTLVVLPPLFILGVVLAIAAKRRGVGAAVYIHSGFNLLAAISFLV